MPQLKKKCPIRHSKAPFAPLHPSFVPYRHVSQKRQSKGAEPYQHYLSSRLTFCIHHFLCFSSYQQVQQRCKVGTCFSSAKHSCYCLGYALEMGTTINCYKLMIAGGNWKALLCGPVVGVAGPCWQATDWETTTHNRDTSEEPAGLNW